ncbi:SUMO protease ULP1 NDAI_0C06270 [Naumovozyma dairenensis CBS 421]|uniref:Ubiquitin-like protease family profile domain-containing protein n=1 Tax=Naumovozyma dairenensis (strain ATCC 10597 / BCRC 20456 / CBS 421 / NBRC 0211 / NRRL Y-12639) TaxID=1071378 RepID=G0W925_NAUDC|nr:hypothetical protein NDAI_0C06270 [Naumovozyma dairenensis CBS 421]CCD24286.1 hypothetical protein NDAI_0C06270 [Naumovozyma dairenensis CBS 421]
MSVATTKKYKPKTRYSPLYSPISTYSTTTNTSDFDYKPNYNYNSSMFNPRRKVNSASSSNNWRDRSIGDAWGETSSNNTNNNKYNNNNGSRGHTYNNYRKNDDGYKNRNSHYGSNNYNSNSNNNSNNNKGHKYYYEANDKTYNSHTRNKPTERKLTANQRRQQQEEMERQIAEEQRQNQENERGIFRELTSIFTSGRNFWNKLTTTDDAEEANETTLPPTSTRIDQSVVSSDENGTNNISPVQGSDEDHNVQDRKLPETNVKRPVSIDYDNIQSKMRKKSFNPKSASPFSIPARIRKQFPRMDKNDSHKRRKANRRNSNNSSNKTSNSKVVKFSKDPFGWHNWETEKIGSHDKNDYNKKSDTYLVQYGTQFIRKHHKRNNSQFNNTANDAMLVLKGRSDEATYLKQIFNGEHLIPKVIQDEKNHQLKLLSMDSKLERRNDLTIRKSIVDLTETIKNVLLDKRKNNNRNQQSNFSNEDDMTIIKERTISSLERKKRTYLHQRLQYDKALIDFEKEFKNYRDLLEERKKIQLDVERKRSQFAIKKLIPTLSDDQILMVQKALTRRDNGLLMNRDNLEIAVRDIKTLAPRRWLNDTVIEFFMKVVEKKTENVVAFNSFFYTTLSERGYSSVRRWLKRKKAQISQLDKIFVPINLNQSHWALCMIDISNKAISYIDSLSNGPSAMSFAILNDLQNYVMEESQNTMGKDFELRHLSCPQQPNGFDCGVYVCMNAFYLSKNSNPTFDSTDAARMRQYIAYLIISDSLK